MHRPQRNQLSEPERVYGICVPQPHSHNTRVVGELDLKVALRGFMLLRGFCDVVEVHDAAHESEVAGSGLEGANVCFFVIDGGLWYCQMLCLSGMKSVAYCPLGGCGCGC